MYRYVGHVIVKSVSHSRTGKLRKNSDLKPLNRLKKRKNKFPSDKTRFSVNRFAFFFRFVVCTCQTVLIALELRLESVLVFFFRYLCTYSVWFAKRQLHK